MDSTENTIYTQLFKVCDHELKFPSIQCYILSGISFIFQLYITWWEREVTIWWDFDNICFVLDQRAYTTVEQFNEITVHRQTDMLLHSNILYRLRANQSLFLLLSGAYLVEKQQIPNLQFDLANLYNTQVVIGRLKIRLMNFKLIHFSCTLVPLLKRPSLLE